MVKSTINKIVWLEHLSEKCFNDEVVFSLNKISKEFSIEKIDQGYFILNKDENWFKFAVLEFHHSFKENNNSNEEIKLSCVFYGEGPCNDGIKELRHTWWGKNGYLYFLNTDLIISAMHKLNNYFND